MIRDLGGMGFESARNYNSDNNGDDGAPAIEMKQASKTRSRCDGTEDLREGVCEEVGYNDVSAFNTQKAPVLKYGQFYNFKLSLSTGVFRYYCSIRGSYLCILGDII